MDLSRRDLLVGLLQALFLALFPWLRNERGAEIVRTAAEHMVSIGVKGFELSPAMYTKIQGMKQLATVGSEVES